MFGLIIAEICLLSIIVDLIILRFFIKNIGIGFWFPKGASLLISSTNFLFIVDADISASYLYDKSVCKVLLI